MHPSPTTRKDPSHEALLIGTNLALSNLGLAAAAVNNLRVTVTLPSGAGNTLQGLTSVINYTFTGTQRAATAQ